MIDNSTVAAIIGVQVGADQLVEGSVGIEMLPDRSFADLGKSQGQVLAQIAENWYLRMKR